MEQATRSAVQTIVGNVGADPVVRESASGKRVVLFSVAVHETDAQGQRRTTWQKVTAWGTLGETYAQSLKKGDLVKVRGVPVHHQWTDQAGQPRSAWLFNARFVRRLYARTQAA